MAFPSTLLVMALLCLSISATLPSTQAFTYNGKTIGSIVTGGIIVCANASISAAGTYRGIPQAPVELRCGNSSTETVLKSGLTDLSGIYFFALTTVDTLLIDPNRCYLRVTIPPNSCTLNIPNGLLRIPLFVLDVVDTLLGLLLFFGQGPYSMVPPRTEASGLSLTSTM